jgi:hypothetical protein
VDVKILSSWVKVISPLMAANATIDLKAGVWFRRTRLPIVSSDLLGTACPLSGRNLLIVLCRFPGPALMPKSAIHRKRRASHVAGRALGTACLRHYPMIDQIRRTARSGLASAGRMSRSLFNVPFQSSIRALMLLQAAPRALSCLCGESPTSSSSSARPLGP